MTKTQGVLVLLTLGSVPVWAADSFPWDAQRGKGTFRAQNCTACHSVEGEGGTSASDLGRRIGRAYTPADMAALLWNHAPAMWSAMRAGGIEPPQLGEQEAADLFAYFYSARYFDRAGDAGRGKRVFESRQCAECHGLTASADRPAAPAATWQSATDPIALAASMWNHSAQMQRAFSSRKMKRPQLNSQEVTDLLIYLQNLPGARRRLAGFSPGSAPSGKLLYEVKGCSGCHQGKRSLVNGFSDRTLTDFAVAMWNHAPKMAGEPVRLSYDEMRRIVGYLWSRQFFDRRGNPERGKRVFNKKNCVSCHSGPSEATLMRAADERRIHSIGMVLSLWQHRSAMLKTTEPERGSWPRFKGSEMPDLIAYLQQSGGPSLQANNR